MASSFSIHEVAPGVHAAVSPGVSGAAVSNATIIDLGDTTIVVDTFMTLRAADELTDAVRTTTGRDAHLVVNTHWHGDHVGGNQAFGSPVVGTRRMAELIAADWADIGPMREQVDAMLAAGPDAPGWDLADALDDHLGRFRVTIPDVLIEDRLVIAGSQRSAEIVTYGPGHTDSDVFVHLPADGVVIAGDLVWNGLHPKTSDGHPAEWAAYVDRLTALDPSTVVPGHGDAGGPGLLSSMSRYMKDLHRSVTAVRAGDASVADVEVPVGSADWDGDARFRAGLAALAG